MKSLRGLLIMFFVAVALFITAATADAQVSADVTGTEITVTYAEPTQNVDGSPLTDLSFTTIYHNFGGPKIRVGEIAASEKTGGGRVSHKFTVPVGENTEVDIDVWATATDGSGNESPESIRATKRIDRLPPAAP